LAWTVTNAVFKEKLHVNLLQRLYIWLILRQQNL